MATGSPDYWATRTNRMNSILSVINAAIGVEGSLVTALDSMDEKLDGVINLGVLTDAETGLLAKLFRIDTVDGDGKNLLTKLDALDGKVDGLMDLDRMELMSIFYDSGASKPRLQLAVENLDGTIGTLKDSIDELVGVHSDTTAMIDYSSEDWDGTVAAAWILISSISHKRNMLKFDNDSVIALNYSRDAGSTTGGSVGALSSVTVYDSPGFWVKAPSGTRAWSAHEEWAT